MVDVLSLPTSQRILTPHLVATLDDTPIPVFSCRTDHGVKKPIGAATFEVPLPLADAFNGARGLNQRIDLFAGMDELGGTAPIFSGRLIDAKGRVSEGGMTAIFRANGWASILDFGAPNDLVWAGETRLDTIVRALAAMRKLPLTLIDDVLWPDGVTPVTLGGNTFRDKGEVRIDRDTSLLTWIQRQLAPWGYFAFDQPNGYWRVQRISGTPNLALSAWPFSTGVNVYQMERSDDLSAMVTYWEVKGPTWTDDDGVTHAPRSIPASVPFNTLLDPPGYRKSSVTHDALDKEAAGPVYPGADAVRNRYEIDYGAPEETEDWDIHGMPLLQPGDVVSVQSDPLGIATGQPRWLMSITQTYDPQRDGYQAVMEGWAGGGTPLPAGNDCEIILLRSAAVHLGDEWLSYYAVPSPSGTEFWLEFDAPAYFSSITILAEMHGCNSYLLPGDEKADPNGNYESTVSKYEVYQGDALEEDDRLGSGKLPMLPENYGKPAVWVERLVPIRLDNGKVGLPGRVKVKIMSGKDSKISEAFTWDDFELRNIRVRICGHTEPDLPGGAG
jgi:hypothetical protein